MQPRGPAARIGSHQLNARDLARDPAKQAGDKVTDDTTILAVMVKGKT